VSNNIDRLPAYSADLIDELNKFIPHRCIDVGTTMEEAHRYAGKRELIDFLVRLRARGDDNILKR